MMPETLIIPVAGVITFAGLNGCEARIYRGLRAKRLRIIREPARYGHYGPRSPRRSRTSRRAIAAKSDGLPEQSFTRLHEVDGRILVSARSFGPGRKRGHTIAYEPLNERARQIVTAVAPIPVNGQSARSLPV